MRNNATEIRFLERKTSRSFKVLPDIYKLNEARGWVPIQRLCFWLLKKIGANSIHETETVYRAPLDGLGLVEKIFKQRSALADEFNMRPDLLLIGAKDYQELMGGDPFREAVQFGGSYGFNGQIMGLRIVVIPWMEGAIVMRDSDLSRDRMFA